MKVIVDTERCEANARCVRAAPEVFLLHDDDTLEVLLPEPPEELRAKVKDAAAKCPRLAITIEG